MTIYIKDRVSFDTKKKIRPLGWEIVESDDGGKSSFIVSPGEVGEENRGDWLLADGVLLTISEVSPGETQTKVTCLDFIAALARPMIVDAKSTTEAFVAAALESIRTDADPMYRMDYLSVRTVGQTDYIPPNADDDGVYALADYLRALAVDHNIRLSCRVVGDVLDVTVAARAPVERTVVMGARAQLAAVPSFSAAATAKIIVLPSGVAYYLKADGSFDTNPDGERVIGAIKMIKMENKTEGEIRARVAQEFGRGSKSRSIEWFSSERFELGDRCRFRVNGAVTAGVVSAITRSSADDRCRYKSGTLARTLTDKIMEVQNT